MFRQGLKEEIIKPVYQIYLWLIKNTKRKLGSQLNLLPILDMSYVIYQNSHTKSDSKSSGSGSVSSYGHHELVARDICSLVGASFRKLRG